MPRDGAKHPRACGMLDVRPDCGTHQGRSRGLKRRAENLLAGFVSAPMPCVHRGYDAAVEMFLLRCWQFAHKESAEGDR